MTLSELLNQSARSVPLHEREILLESILGVSRSELYLNSKRRFTEEQVSRYQSALFRRESGEPLQHITGCARFLGHDYAVGPDVLVPRPETEVLAQCAIDTCKRERWTRGLEVGLGSGCISIELLSANPALTMVATEASEDALERALSNASRILGGGADRLQSVRVKDASQIRVNDAELPKGGANFDFLISNPPYLLDETESTEEVHRFEPALALYAPAGDPLFFYRELVLWAASMGTPPRAVFFEVDPARAVRVGELLEQAGYRVEGKDDLTGRRRVVFGLRK